MGRTRKLREATVHPCGNETRMPVEGGDVEFDRKIRPREGLEHWKRTEDVSQPESNLKEGFGSL